ncbi:hypothetical protein CCHR01_06558 [Colletotrichum chrysophilum]|uniref:Uncharacterized protein n=1 Tax=Colletotrichum chrysophilum TaxID=1836956 RepID=A0AAD9ANG8_9PEZI|nr:hypothetical protein CCHR01_06558 [Colletotrichum chrysophilum]
MPSSYQVSFCWIDPTRAPNELVANRSTHNHQKADHVLEKVLSRESVLQKKHQIRMGTELESPGDFNLNYSPKG